MQHKYTAAAAAAASADAATEVACMRRTKAKTSRMCKSTGNRANTRWSVATPSTMISRERVRARRSSNSGFERFVIHCTAVLAAGQRSPSQRAFSCRSRSTGDGSATELVFTCQRARAVAEEPGHVVGVEATIESHSGSAASWRVDAIYYEPQCVSTIWCTRQTDQRCWDEVNERFETSEELDLRFLIS